MDIERLSKSQIILLTLLVSFVTSIATGIVTVSLMDQAPPSVAQTVNRIVERTVEKVVPAGQTASSVITREKTIVVKESELISQAVAKISPSVARLYAISADPPQFLGLGIVLDGSGTVAADSAVLGDSGDATIIFPDGTRVRAFVAERNRNSGLAFLKSATTTTDGKTPNWKPAAVSAGHSVLGQTVIALAGKNLPRISDGIVTALVPRTSADSPLAAEVIDTNISTDFILPGSLLVNTDGEVIGISTMSSREISLGGFVSSSALAKQSAPPPKESATPK